MVGGRASPHAPNVSTEAPLVQLKLVGGSGWGGFYQILGGGIKTYPGVISKRITDDDEPADDAEEPPAAAAASSSGRGRGVVQGRQPRHLWQLLRTPPASEAPAKRVRRR